MLQISNLYKSYGKFQAVNNLTLHIPKGDLFGFQSGVWLIQNQQRRIVDQSPGYTEPLFHAPGKCVHKCLFFVRKIYRRSPGWWER
mgnify:CR=1 FL=1